MHLGAHRSGANYLLGSRECEGKVINQSLNQMRYNSFHFHDHYFFASSFRLQQEQKKLVLDLMYFKYYTVMMSAYAVQRGGYI